ncbi:MAG: PD-(D/E)XK nuclease family protein, partial [Spirochaetaceae bacterium]|nr:PD-(D/E)XK nuclease family protein [Spirochaetaceae bacterium]
TESCAEVLEEEAWFKGIADELPGVLPQYQKDAALGRFAAISGHGQSTATDCLLPLFEMDRRNVARPERLLTVLSGLHRGYRDSKAIFTPSRLRDYSACPFKWLISLMPDLQAQGGDIANFAEGSLSHLVISSLFGEIRDHDGRFMPENESQYLAMLDASLATRMRDILREYGPAVEPALKAAIPKIRHRLASLLDHEIEFEAAGWEIGRFEVPLSMDCVSIGALLEGRADRISQRQGEKGIVLALIDYKKNKAPQKREYYLDEYGRLKDLQLAAYAEILVSAGNQVETAVYWSIEGCRESVVFGPTGKNKDFDDFGRERQAVEKMLETAAHSVHAGRIMTISRSKDGCKECNWKPLCRAHFSLEAP